MREVPHEGQGFFKYPYESERGQSGDTHLIGMQDVHDMLSQWMSSLMSGCLGRLYRASMLLACAKYYCRRHARN